MIILNQWDQKSATRILIYHPTKLASQPCKRSWTSFPQDIDPELEANHQKQVGKQWWLCPHQTHRLTVHLETANPWKTEQKRFKLDKQLHKSGITLRFKHNGWCFISGMSWSVIKIIETCSKIQKFMSASFNCWQMQIQGKWTSNLKIESTSSLDKLSS